MVCGDLGRESGLQVVVAPVLADVYGLLTQSGLQCLEHRICIIIKLSYVF